MSSGRSVIETFAVNFFPARKSSSETPVPALAFESSDLTTFISVIFLPLIPTIRSPGWTFFPTAPDPGWIPWIFRAIWSRYGSDLNEMPSHAAEKEYAARNSRQNKVRFKKFDI